MSSRKHVLFLAPTAILLALSVGVDPASAADDSANCVGEFASFYNQFGKSFVGGLGGRLVSDAALREGGVARYASIDNCD